MNPQHAPSSSPDAPIGSSAEQAPFISLHTAVVLLAALVLGFVVGGLSYLSGAPVAAAVLTGLTGTGAAVPVLRTLIQ